MLPSRTPKSIEGLRDMCEYIAKLVPINNMRIIEIGSWVGTSAVEFAKYFKKVICVDPFIPIKGTITACYEMQEVEDAFKENIAPFPNISHIKHRSTEFLLSLFGERADAIYIDGEHTYKAVKADIGAALKLNPVILCGHDYWPGKFPGVIKAVNEIIGKPDKLFKDTSWLKYYG